MQRVAISKICFHWKTVQDSQWQARIYLIVILWAMCTRHVTSLHPTLYPNTNMILQRPNLNPRPTLHRSPILKLSFEFSLGNDFFSSQNSAQVTLPDGISTLRFGI